MSLNLTLVRRTNLHTLLHEFVRTRVDQGALPKGLEQEFAAQVQISPSMLSQIKSSRPVGDKLARQIEVLCGQPALWLDAEHDETPVQALEAEERFIALAREAWRSADHKAKRELRRCVRDQIKAQTSKSAS
jgi:predicted TIM-barrel fold metal-dependent hydrolase